MMRARPIATALMGIWTIASLAGCLGGGRRLPDGAAYRKVLDDETGWTIHELAVGKDTGWELSARVVPEAGANLCSLRVNDVELLRAPEEIGRLRGIGYGIPILYPTPNRVRDGKFSFEERQFELPANAGGHHIHGLVHSEPWKAGTLAVEDDSLTLPVVLEIDEGHPVYAAFPFKHRVSLSYTLGPEGLRIAVAIENLDTRRIPIGFGLHPYFRVLGERSGTFVTVPARKHMENYRSTLLPTGKLLDLDGTSRDLRSPVSLAELDLDDVFWGMQPDRPASYEARDRGLRVVLRASEIFTHMVVYTPRGKDYFCLENQTCSTDAHNLYAKGFTDAAHLLILEPVGSQGSSVEGSVLIEIE
ncbi:MAG: aldose 1-epimerase, partial [Planctomycetes bacterium]|nr:aldose 1-epimerase [Planctomycetota bacterium]